MPWRFLILLGLGIYSFTQDSVGWGIFIILLAIIIEVYLFGKHYLGRINYQKGMEGKPYTIKIAVNIGNLLKSSSLSHYLDDLFEMYGNKKLDKIERLAHQERSIDGLTRDKIEKSLLEHEIDFGMIQFKFDIQGNCVFCNDKPSGGGKIFGEVFIPYDKKYDGLCFITTGLSIRAFVVNGILRVQVGRLIRKKEERLDIIQFSLSDKPCRFPMTAAQFNVDDDILFEDGGENYHNYFKGFKGAIGKGVFQYPAYYRLYKYMKILKKLGKGKNVAKNIGFFEKEAFEINKRYNIEDAESNMISNKFATILFYENSSPSYTRFGGEEPIPTF